MDEVDIENADDLNELEARLYAQIHHEPSGDCDFADYKEAAPVRQVTSTSVINNKPVDRTRVGRYWNDKSNSVRTPVKPKPTTPATKVTQSQTQQQQINVNPPSGEFNESPAETVDKSFQPPVKTLSNLRVNPFASGNDPKTEGSSSKPQNPFAAKSKKNTNQKTDEKKGPFDRQLTKLAHAVKYENKRQKAKVARAKAKKQQPVGTIEILSSSDSETDEVIEVPLPSPKILTIDSSSEEETPNTSTQKDAADFVKPQTVTVVKENTSRCTSPCSVISDDFIGQNDCSRVLNDTPDDEDILTLQIDVDSLMEDLEKTTEKEAEEVSFVEPAQTSTTRKSSEYRVMQDDFRALDVYESESDIQDSVYSKGTKPSLVVRLEHESSSNDDVEEVDLTQKTKRLRKRASSSNKESESFIESTDSEQENETNNQPIRFNQGVVKTRVPFISRGEAVEKFVTHDQPPNPQKVNSSDTEFFANLNTLANADTSDEEDEGVTARAIAETVLERENRLMEASEPVIQHDEDANDAIPNDSIAELDQVFEKIDNMNKTTSQMINESDGSDQSVELIAPLPVARKKSTTMQKKLENNTGDPVYNIVYCEGATHFGGIGWNEEMRKFYNSSWNGERFSVRTVCSKMKTTKSLWKIYTDDRFPKNRKRSNLKCMNCCEFGHIRARCPQPRKPQVCYMCGERGHHEPRCPNTVCLRCGNKTRIFTKSCNACNYQNRLICPICKVRGHSINLCPDKWRRYHSTTKPNQYPNDKVEYKRRKFCCICGMHGHLADHCRNGFRFSEYPLFVSEIRSHQKSYDDISVQSIRSGIGYNLMYKPVEDLSFELAENKTSRHYYGRFLIAVGMDYLLKRKRKVDAPAEGAPADKQQKVSNALKDYVVNPFAKAALEKSPAKPTAAIRDSDNPTTVEPIDLDDQPSTSAGKTGTNSGTDHIDLDALSDTEPSTATEQLEASNAPSTSIQMDLVEVPKKGPSTSTFKTPGAASPSVQARKTQEILDVIDSDSNYSFSEHFEPTQQKDNPMPDREMEALPDFIPINDDDGDMSAGDGNVGISKRFVSVDTDEENSNNESTPLPDLPCQAKIYLTNFHSKFLLSPDGNKFLIEKSMEFNIKASLDWTSVGHILVIHGLRFNQDKFHTELLHKFRELSDKLNRKQLENSQKIPKKTEVLIRFLREHLNQLMSNLGNVHELYKRLTFQENQHTKSGWKSAEKTRRFLNMILIGQAGLRNGSMHLDNLLSHLRHLIDECKDDVVPNEVRDEIDSHWRLIFSSHRHEKYDQLVEAYTHMQVKNRLQNINIDPRLLGKNLLDTSLTKAQKDKMDKRVEPINEASRPEKQPHPTTPKIVFNPAAKARQVKAPLSEKKKGAQVNSPSVSQINSQKQVGTMPSPSVTTQATPKRPQQTVVANSPAAKAKPVNAESPSVSMTNTPKRPHPAVAANSPAAKTIKASNEWETKCVNLLTEINNTEGFKKGQSERDNKAASVFWSREAMKYIDECMQLGKSNPGIMAKLKRVQIKSQNGQLSYNDYRAIIKIHNAIKGKQ